METPAKFRRLPDHFINFHCFHLFLITSSWSLFLKYTTNARWKKQKQTSDSLQFQSSVCFHMFLLSFCSFILCNKGILFFVGPLQSFTFLQQLPSQYLRHDESGLHHILHGRGVISKEFAIHPVDFFPKTHILKINAAHHYMCFINSCRLQNMRNSCEAHVDLCFDSTFRGFSRKWICWCLTRYIYIFWKSVCAWKPYWLSPQ